MSKQNKKEKFIDYKLITVTLFLICFGLIMLYSTSYYSAEKKFGDDMYFFVRQGIYSTISFFVMFVVSKVNIKILKALSPVLWLVSIGLMLLVRTPLGVESYGARRWLGLPLGITFQPSEIAKISIILFMPCVICKSKSKSSKRSVANILMLSILTCFVVYFFNDHLSSAIIIFIITIGLIFVVHKKTGIFIVIGGGLIASFFAFAVILGEIFENAKSFRISRILVWLHPEKHTKSGGYQILQGLYAIGSGGLLGKGLGNSTQKLGVIPEVQNDMILAILCEELGITGVLILLGLFIYLLYRLVYIARNAPDLYSSLVATGIFIHIALQVILNICVVLNVIPATGITLPFISYGGTSILFLMCEIGIALGISNKIMRREYETEINSNEVQK